MSGFAVEKIAGTEVVAAWTVPQSVVTAGQAWLTIGEYFLPKKVTAQLELVGLVSAGGLTLTLRLWDVATAAPVNGAVAITSTSPVRALGTKVELEGGHTYQVQVQCLGAVGDSKFGIVGSATITD